MEHETFIAEQTVLAEKEIMDERKKLIESKLKKELGQITQAQITTWILNHDRDTYKSQRARLEQITRTINKLTRLDKILSQRADKLDSILNRHTRTPN